MDKEEIEYIIDKAYPLIQRYYGKGKKSYPVIELHRDIYARLSGDPEQSGEHSSSSIAEYNEITNEIYIYYPNIKNEKELLKSMNILITYKILLHLKFKFMPKTMNMIQILMK